MIDRVLEQDLSVEERSKALASKALQLGQLGRGPDMLESAQQAYDLMKSPLSARAVARALSINGRGKDALPFYEEADLDTYSSSLEYAQALRYAGRWREASKIERKHHRPIVQTLNLPRWRGESCKTLHWFCDDGLGDVICNTRYFDLI